MNKILIPFLLILCWCHVKYIRVRNGEIQTLQLFKKAFDQSNETKVFSDAKKLLNREQIDTFAIPILYVELASGQNGTLVPYPERDGQTWLEQMEPVTLQRGVVKASRGMGDDLMTLLINAAMVKNKNNHQIYSRKQSYITGNNDIYSRIFRCDIQKADRGSIIEVWDVEFPVTEFKGLC